MAARSPLPSPPLSNYSYDAAPAPLMSITTSSSSATSTPGPTSAPTIPPPPAPPVQPSTIAPPPIQTASDMADAEKVKKKHVCPTCSRPFTTSGHLARHLRVHTGERNHKCPFPGCETRCSRQDNLQQHYRIHLSPRSRRNSNAATRAAIAKAMEAQASGGSPQPAASPSTTLTLPPQPAPRHPAGRAPPSPIENALGLDSPNGPPNYAGRSTLAVHHPSAVPPRYPPAPGQFGGYDSPRSSSASSVQSGAPASASNPGAAYPSPYSTGPVHHPLPPTGASGAAANRTVSYDRVNGGANFQSPQSPAPNAYPSPEESHHPSTATNGYGGSYANQQASYSHNYSIPPPGNAQGYYPPPPQRAPQQASSYGPSGHPQSPPPILPPIQGHPHHQWNRYAGNGSGWASSGPGQAQGGGHGSSSESGDEGGAQGGAAGNGYGQPPQRPVSVSGGGPGSY